MSSKLLGNLLRISVLFITLCGLVACIFIAPMCAEEIIESYPEFSSWQLPWQIFIWVVALPCFAVMFFGWRVADAVISESVFTLRTAKWIKTSAILLITDAIVFFAGNVVLLLFSMNHPGVLLLSIVADVFIVILAIILAILSRYLCKAAELQEESDGTL